MTNKRNALTLLAFAAAALDARKSEFRKWRTWVGKHQGPRQLPHLPEQPGLRQALLDLQDEVRLLLKQLIDVRTKGQRAAILTVSWDKPPSTAVKFVPPDGSRIVLEGPVRGSKDGFRAFAYETLQEHGDRLRRCPDPKCDVLFIRSGKEKYCTTGCRARHRMRELRQKDRDARRGIR
jgi:hypothetical protein